MPTKYQVGEAGQHLVAAEIFRRGGFAALLMGNRPDVDLLASSPEQDRTVAVQVKTKSRGSWHSSIERGEPRKEDPAESRFWVLVDIGRDPELEPSYWIVPDWWMVNQIYERTQSLKLDQRPSGTKHFGIQLAYVAEWRDRWELLGIFPPEEAS